MTTYGLDLSAHNGSLDFKALKAAGNSFVILRAGYGWSVDQKDPTFDGYYAQAKAAGMKVGAYWYSYARNLTEAYQEAKCFLEIIKGKQFEMPVYIDMEDADGWKRANGNPSGATQAQIANKFMETVEAAGYFTGIYASSSWFNSFLTGLSDAYTRWEANWGNNDGSNHGGVSNPIHQYTSQYKLNGKTFDRNVYSLDFEAAIRRNGLNGFAKESAASGFDMETWISDHMGTFLNPDGVYDYQCVDVFKQLNLDLGMVDGAKALGGDGLAYRIWTCRTELGYMDYYDEAPLSNLQYGDVVIFGRGGDTPDSHVGLYTGMATNGKMFVFGQNQGGATIAGKRGSACNVTEVSTASLIGALRIKAVKASTGTGSTTNTKKSNSEIAAEVIAGKWGNGTDRTNRLKAAGYDPTAIQALVNAQLARKSDDEIAREVIAGKWGDGATRKQKLEAAGYNYNTVQSRVNALLSQKSVTEVAKEVIAGKWGNGQDRVNRLKAAGYDSVVVQAEVNRMLS